MSDLDELVSASVADDVPPSGAQERTWQQLTGRVAAGAPAPIDWHPPVTEGAAATAGSAGAGAPIGSSASWVIKVLVVVVGVGGAGALAYGTLWGEGSEPAPKTAVAEVASQTPPQRPDEQPVAPPEEDEEMAGEAQEPAAVPSPPPTPEGRATTRGARPAAKRRAPRAEPDRPVFASEIELVADAQRALKRGQPRRALRILDRHGTEFPGGLLTEEVMASRVLTLCELGRVDKARAAAERFVNKYPASPQVDRVRGACR